MLVFFRVYCQDVKMLAGWDCVEARQLRNANPGIANASAQNVALDGAIDFLARKAPLTAIYTFNEGDVALNAVDVASLQHQLTAHLFAKAMCLGCLRLDTINYRSGTALRHYGVLLFASSCLMPISNLILIPDPPLNDASN